MANYDPYGVLQSGTPGAFGFTGALQQGSDVFLRARWYDAGRGRFTARDPFAGWGETPYSLHPYAYGYSDPINNFDPSGYATCKCNYQYMQVSHYIKSKCEANIDKVRNIIAKAKAKAANNIDRAHSKYRTYGFYLTNDIIAKEFTMMLMGLDGNEADLIANHQKFELIPALKSSKHLGKAIGKFHETESVSVWEHDAGMLACIYSNIYSDPYEGAYRCKDKKPFIITSSNHPPSAHAQLEYGFKKEYWSNTHHFIFGFSLEDVKESESE